MTHKLDLKSGASSLEDAFPEAGLPDIATNDIMQFFGVI